MQDRPDDLAIATERAGPVEALVRVTGELDIRTSPLLRRELATVLAGPGIALMRLDLSGVTFCDQAGLRALAALDASTGPDRVRIVAAHPAVDTILLLCGAGRFLGYTAGVPSRTG